MHRCWQPARLTGQRGLTLLEVAIALVLLGLIIPLVLGGLSAATTTTDRVYDRSVLFELAQSQLEAFESQPYSDSAGGYTIIPTPAGYSIEVAVSSAVNYTYAAPLSTATQQTVQLITVTVTGVQGNMVISRYRVRE